MRALVVLAICAVLTTALGEPQCDSVNSLDRFDCFPEDASSEEQCLARGCCWSSSQEFDGGYEVGFPPLNVPYCYFPKNYQGYRVKNQTDDNVIYIERVTPSKVDEDIKLLRVEIIRQTNGIVRIRIVDPSTRRWEPPLPVPPVPETSVIPKYRARITDDTKLEISRFETDQAQRVLVSFDLAKLVYTDRFIQISTKLPSHVIYGLGEHKGSLRRSTNFTRLTFYNQDRPPSYDARLYGTHPLYINIEDDGLANGVWLFNSNAMDVILQPTPAITYRTIGGILDFFVFVGPTPADVVKQYQEIVGRPKMIPYWSLGYHLCRFGYRSTEDTRRIMQKNLDAGVRIDVQWNDIDYMDERNDFTLDMKNYNDLGAFVDDIHKDGRHYVLIVDPAVSGSEKPGSYPPYDRGLEYDVFVKDIHGKIVQARVWNKKSSVYPDFTHPNATPYWTEMFNNFHKKIAFDGAWIDMNEPSNLINGHLNSGCPDDNSLLYTPGDEDLHIKTICTSDQHYWSSHYNVHNMYGFTEAIATYNALSSVRPNKRPFIISRSSFSGHGFYAGHWTGDVYSTWTDLKDSVPGFLEFSFYGIPMVGVDICGFNGNTTEELCARWQALGAFYPFSRNHNTDDGTPQDPASMGGKVLTVTKNAYYWRYKLLPYLYTLFYKAHVYGETVARPLFFEYPTDSNTYDNDEQFMLGDALMVVPALYQNQKNIKAYFPDGIWFDIQNRSAAIDATEGGLYVDIPAFEDTISFFMKGGSSVFYQEPGQTTTDSRKQPFGLYVFMNGNYSTGSVYLDDGESIDSIEKNNYSVVRVVADENQIIIASDSGKPVGQNLQEVHVYGLKSKPIKVLVNDQETSGIVYDDSRQIVKIYNMNNSMQFLTISFVYWPENVGNKLW